MLFSHKLSKYPSQLFNCDVPLLFSSCKYVKTIWILFYHLMNVTELDHGQFYFASESVTEGHPDKGFALVSSSRKGEDERWRFALVNGMIPQLNRLWLDFPFPVSDGFGLFLSVLNVFDHFFLCGIRIQSSHPASVPRLPTRTTSSLEL